MADPSFVSFLPITNPNYWHERLSVSQVSCHRLLPYGPRNKTLRVIQTEPGSIQTPASYFDSGNAGHSFVNAHRSVNYYIIKDVTSNA